MHFHIMIEQNSDALQGDGESSFLGISALLRTLSGGGNVR